ncbi:uncharacterized protein A1O9_04737 [Exophiala aquamarina CBS 119918]|uniref:Uncharacterized protein n=1 Tax=Exophiala aquamarina CBS 119918 TaxID=1182545 RepID=A0A072PIF3_9EURO|nr:uncharacterized protein A1O9_04737 [Exophiala aquamarina CBS 119918]KEF59889.1 hypothetical protein A1O9_04737 [Exophiala aquamarina CBS 119918]
MDTQLDQIVIQSILLPLRKEVLQRLQVKFEKFQRKDWFEIFATVFILLNTIEIATRHDHEFATSYGHVSPTGGKRFEDYKLVDSYFHGAQTLIAHFRDAPDGHTPIIQASTAPEKVAKMAEMNIEETNFMHQLRNYMNDGKRGWLLQPLLLLIT